MRDDVFQLWTYLGEEPLLWLTVTLLAYLAGDGISRIANRAPLANPVLIAVILLAGILALSGTAYETYFEGAQFVHFLLGPATVALAAPMHANLERMRRSALPIITALLAGGIVSVGSAAAIGWALGLEPETLLSLLPKSATAPVAMGVSETIGGVPALTAVLVIVTGMTGALIVTPLFNRLGLKDWRARGFALGMVAHGIGTARAFQINETAGAFSGIGMGLGAIVTAVVVPVIVIIL